MITLSQSPTDPAFVQDPYPFYTRARAAGDLVHWAEYGMAMATSHRAVSDLLRDARLGREAPTGYAAAIPDHLRDFYAVEHHSMLERAPPAHTRLRRAVLRAFTSARINGLAPQIAALCDTLIDAFPGGDFDLLTAYAKPLPVTIIARLIGIDAAMTDRLLGWSTAMVAMYQAARTYSDECAANAAARDFTAHLRDCIARARRTPRDTLLSHLANARGDGGATLSDPEITATCILLLNAGHEATVHTIGNAVAWMLRHGLTPTESAPQIEELIRLDPPLHIFTRWIYEDCTLWGQDFARGDRVGLLLASAGRDAAVYPDPDRFIEDRTGAAHLAFGGGAHFCLGAPLARLELQIALPRLMQRCPDLTPTAMPSFANIYPFHGLKALNVRR